MNRNQIKEATDAFLDELIDLKFSHNVGRDFKIYSLYLGGRYIGDFSNQDNTDTRLKGLRAKVGKVYRKHLKKVLEES